MSAQRFDRVRVGRNFIRVGDICDVKLPTRKQFHHGFRFKGYVVNGDKSWCEVYDPVSGFTKSVTLDRVRRVQQTKGGVRIKATR